MKHKRHISLKGQSNFRDLGGYTTTDGLTVQWRQVYRSGRLVHLTDGDIERLGLLGIRMVVNFLTEDDIGVYGHDRLPDGAQSISLAIDSHTTTALSNQATAALKTGDFSKIPVELNQEIHRILVHDGRQQYASLLRLIADPANRPLVFHCSHGVHRTGTGAAILLAALGVSWQTVREDYLLSNQYRQDEVNHRLVQLRRMSAEKREITPDQVDMTNMRTFLVQEGSYIDASRGEILTDFGSMSGYLQGGLGLNKSEVTRLQETML